MLPQISHGWLRRPLAWELGVALLMVGLMKKVLLADPLAPAVDGLFSRAAQGEWLSGPEVLMAGLAYGLQLYFDFSGYADMALGLGLMFGIRLPVNFRSPYKSASIVEFWRRWHITLSHFLRDYLYIPLGGSRAGRFRANGNLMVTMLLGGLWHGAGWQFILWGGLHGAMLVLSHTWSRLVPWRIPRAPAVILTLVAVMLAWIPFRAESLATALHMYAGLLDWRWVWQFDAVTILRELMSMRVDQGLPWVSLALLLLVLNAPGSRALCLALGSWGRGLLVGAGIVVVLKVMAGEPDRAFLYFNF
jgi:D-alanyl-lipoteichoic acid acyltransferase DltB (MBOAT superfamily)